MRAGLYVVIFFAFILNAEPIRADDVDIKSKPMSIITRMDFGQIVKGYSDQTQSNSYSGQFLPRTGVWLSQETTIKDRLQLKIGVYSIIWYALPELQSAPEALLPRFVPGISQGSGLYKFGDLNDPSAELQLGYFPYKYNPDAEDLGEYLLRSGTYPGFLVSGNWNIINSANYLVQGVRLGFKAWDGKFKSDFIVGLEHDYPPMNDISPSYVGSLKPMQGVEVGFGATYNHLIPINPSKDTPHGSQVADASGVQEFLNGIIIPNPHTGPYASDSTDQWVRDSTQFYTYRGVKLMARLSVDPKSWMGGADLLGPNDLKIYAEAAILGVKNYPFFYNDIWNRIPIMFGLNLPTFKWLDILSLQFQYYNSRFPNSIENVTYESMPIWKLPDDNPNKYNPNDPGLNRDNWKWAVYAKREVTKGLSVHLQMADDYFRPFDYNQRPASTPITNTISNWYYLFRLEMGI